MEVMCCGREGFVEGTWSGREGFVEVTWEVGRVCGFDVVR